MPKNFRGMVEGVVRKRERRTFKKLERSTSSKAVKKSKVFKVCSTRNFCLILPKSIKPEFVQMAILISLQYTREQAKMNDPRHFYPLRSPPGGHQLTVAP